MGEDEEPSITTDPSTRTYKTLPSSYQQEKEQEQQVKKKIKLDIEECSSCKELGDENRELKEIVEKSSQFSTADKTVATEEPYRIHDDEMDKSILLFEFPMHCNELQNHMDLLFRNSGSDGKVWFNGKIVIKTGKVISKNFGRMDRSSSNRMNPN